MKHIAFIFVILFLLPAAVFAQSVPSYVPTNGLLGWWPLDGNGNDLSVNQNNATNYGCGWVSDRFGTPNSAAGFNGSVTYLEVETPGFSLSETGAFTFSVWVKKQVQVTWALSS